ncbi:unnamed protein product [Pleuronectes platessa]|uniref:Uncharacterized protein n=1 Tax=Pleuronectes platessa TaxID=8262 RepID=A0A9N7YGL0_PLEPL|nr:unnamed protein product [Pleuronectes platessa]
MEEHQAAVLSKTSGDCCAWRSQEIPSVSETITNNQATVRFTRVPRFPPSPRLPSDKKKKKTTGSFTVTAVKPGEASGTRNHTKVLNNLLLGKQIFEDVVQRGIQPRYKQTRAQETHVRVEQVEVTPPDLQPASTESRQAEGAPPERERLQVQTLNLHRISKVREEASDPKGSRD